MNAVKKDTNELPQDVEMLLPWHAAGTLSRRDAARVEQALANDNELAARYDLVREELGEAIRLNENLGAPSARAMEALFAKIDAEPVRKPKVSFNITAWMTNFVASFSPRACGTRSASSRIRGRGTLRVAWSKYETIAASSFGLLTSKSSTVMRPAFSFSSPLMQRIRVDLPDPEEPRIDTTSPGLTVRFTPSRTTASPKAFLTFSTFSMDQRPRKALCARSRCSSLAPSVATTLAAR